MNTVTDATDGQTTALGDEAGVILVFSGGGARSAAFGFGVLDSLSSTITRKGHALTDTVDVVGGVSGGGILAAYFAAKGPKGLGGFRQDFLEANPEKSLSMRFSPLNMVRGYRGGVNDVTALPNWLDKNLFHGKRFGDLPARPRLLLHATDLYNRMPFTFDASGFADLCSDIESYPLSLAVSASAAVPLAFAPVVLRNYSTGCPLSTLPWSKGRRRPEGLMDMEVDRGIGRLRTDPSIQYLKLYDGGLVDGTGALVLTEALRHPAPYPLPSERAREIRHILVLVVDASTRWGGALSETAALPFAPETLVAAVDAMINIPNIQSVDRLKPSLASWTSRLAAWRCLPGRRHSCTLPTVDIARIALSDIASPALRNRILSLHNRFTLKPDDSRFLEGLGQTELQRNPDYRRFLRRIRASAPPA